MAKVQRTVSAAMGLILSVLLLGGCGAARVPETISQNSLVIGKEGTVTAYTVGVFDREYYNLQGLRAMAQEEAAAYNTAHQKGTTPPVLVEQVASLEEDGRVVVAYRYDCAETYVQYGGTPLFYGTAAQARTAGYNPEELNQVLYDPKGKNSIVSAALNGEGLSGKHVILVWEPLRVYCPGRVAYVSEGAGVLEDGSVDATGVDDGGFPVIIVMTR